MPSIGWSEMLMLAVVAIVVVGPKELPRLMRVVGHWVGKARAAAREFQNAFDEMARESEIEEMRRKMETMRSGSAFPDFDEDYEQDTPARAAGGNGSHSPDTDASGETARPADEKADEKAAESGTRPVPSH